MDDIFQDFYAVESTNGYTAANILSGFWISDKKAFENLVTTKEQDAHEFFQFLAEELHERNGDGKRPEVGSEHSCNCVIHQIFYGKMLTTTTCQKCNTSTDAVQSFLDLSLGLESLSQKRKKGDPKPLTLRECLDAEYIKSDKCEYRCQECRTSQQARRRTSIKCLPNVLAIHLKVSTSCFFYFFSFSFFILFIFIYFFLFFFSFLLAAIFMTLRICRDSPLPPSTWRLSFFHSGSNLSMAGMRSLRLKLKPPSNFPSK